MSSKFKVTKWVRLPIDSYLSSMSIYPPIPGICFFKIWLWKSKVKVIAEGHIVGPPSYWLTSLLFHVNPTIPEIQLFLKFDLENSRSGSWESAKFKVTKCVPLAINTHLSFSVWKVAGPHALNLKAWELSVFTLIFPLKTHLSSLSTPTHLISFSFLSSSAYASRYHLPSSCCTICGPNSVPYVLSHRAIRPQPSSIVPLCHPSYTFHPSPSILHRPSVAPSLQPPAPSIPSPHYPLAASSLCPSGVQLNEIWLEVSWISLLSFSNDRHLYKKYQQQHWCNLLGNVPCVFYWERNNFYIESIQIIWVFRAGLRLNYQNHCPSILQGFVWSWL